MDTRDIDSGDTESKINAESVRELSRRREDKGQRSSTEQSKTEYVYKMHTSWHTTRSGFSRLCPTCPEAVVSFGRYRRVYSLKRRPFIVIKDTGRCMAMTGGWSWSGTKVGADTRNKS